MVDYKRFTGLFGACAAAALATGCVATVPRGQAEARGYESNVPRGYAPNPLNAAGRAVQGSEVAPDNPCEKIGVNVIQDSYMLRSQLGLRSGYMTSWGPGFMSTRQDVPPVLAIPVSTVNNRQWLAVFDNEKSRTGEFLGLIGGAVLGSQIGGGRGRDAATAAGALLLRDIGKNYDKGSNAANSAEGTLCRNWIMAGGPDYIMPVHKPAGSVLVPGQGTQYPGRQQQDIHPIYRQPR